MSVETVELSVETTELSVGTVELSAETVVLSVETVELSVETVELSVWVGRPLNSKPGHERSALALPAAEGTAAVYCRKSRYRQKVGRPKKVRRGSV